MTAAPSPNHGPRRGGLQPSLIVIHYTGMATCAEARARLCDPVAEVSAHWLISETGVAEPLVDERFRAWHAGAGMWAGLDDINSHSIGIELQNSGDAPFPAPQMVALETLLADAQAWAAELSQASSTALALTKTILNQSFELSSHDVFAQGSQAQGICYTSSEHRASVEAFLANNAAKE